MSTKYNIEELFKKKFEGYEERPSGDAWAKTQRVLKRRQFMRFNPRRLNIYYTVGAVLIGAAVAVVSFAGNDQPQNQPEINESITQNQATTPKANSESLSERQTSNQQPATSNQQLDKPQSQPAVVQNLAATGDQQHVTKQTEKSTPTSNNQSEKTVPEQNIPAINTMVAYFIPSVREGCAPLTVKFKNLSGNANSYEWNLGDNQPATTTQQPVNIYNDPGNYTVTLTVTDKAGLTLTHSETITVHPKPKADFEISDDYIYNYSTDATKYTWSLMAQDTQIISSDFQLPYSEVASNQPTSAEAQRRWERQLSLIASNLFGCSDTTKKTLPKTNTPSLSFPTVFSPNPDGPTGGYYSQNDINNNVFHPAFKEEPLEYKLKIFSKAGELIFESNDIYKGWDGYYNQQISTKGVYIYHVSGKWKSGNEFSFKGDVTILWNE